MYNAEQKSRFAKEYTGSISVREACLNAFNAFEEYEERWGADLCTQTADVLQPVVNELTGLRKNSVKARLTIYREYVRWCIKNGVPGACDGMLGVDYSGLTKMSSQTVKNPMHLQKYLNSIYDAESDNTADNTFRCFYWLAYSGMREADIFNVTPDCVDFESMVVRYDGEEYPLYRESLAAIKNCVSMKQFIYNHANYSASKVVYRDRAPGDVIIRGIRGTPSVRSLRSELSKHSKEGIESGKTELKLSYYRVWISGIFYRMYESELAGADPDFSGVVEVLTDGKTYKLDSGRNTVSSKRRRLSRDYLFDYNRWKMTLTKLG